TSASYRSRESDRLKNRRPARRGPPRTLVDAPSALAGELLALHVDPQLLGHLGGPDGRAAEDRLQRIRGALEVDREPTEWLLRRRFRHLSPSSSWCGAAPHTTPGVLLPHLRGEVRKKHHPWGSRREPNIPPEGISP